MAGFQLWLLQRGDLPDDWKSMSIIGAGTIEVRVRLAGAYRVIAVTRFEEAIYVLHAFAKKSRKRRRQISIVPQGDIAG